MRSGRLFSHGRFPHADVRWKYPPGAAAILSLPRQLPAAISALPVHRVVVRPAHYRAARAHGDQAWLVARLLVLDCGNSAARPRRARPLRHVRDAVRGGGTLPRRLTVEPRSPGRAWGGGEGMACAGVVRRPPGAAARRWLPPLPAPERSSAATWPSPVVRSVSWRTRTREASRSSRSPRSRLRCCDSRDLAWPHGVALRCLSARRPGCRRHGRPCPGQHAAGVSALVWWRRRLCWRPEVAGDAALTATLLMVATSRVISVQYMIWLIGMAGVRSPFRERHSARSRWGYRRCRAHADGIPLLVPRLPCLGAAAGTVVVAVRDALLLALAVLAFVRLWRWTRPPGDLEEPGVTPSEQELQR